MVLENFPSCETGKRMLDTISKGFYDNSYVGKWIFQVMGLEMEEARRLIEELPYQAFPETATWGLRYHEQKYGLPVRERLAYEERRRFIYQKRDERTPMNPYRMEIILENITGRKAHVDDELGPVNTFTVELESGSNAVDVTAAIKKLKIIKQSHVTYTVRFTALARIEICGRIDRYKSRYPLCGTVPITSTGLRLLDIGTEVVPETHFYKQVMPVSGDSGKTGQYPKTSSGLVQERTDVEIEASGIGTEVKYSLTGEKDTGTVPKVSTGIKESENSVIPEVSTESYQIKYPLCGSTFEI